MRSTGRGGGRALGDGGDGEGGERRAEELDGGHADRVAAAEQAVAHRWCARPRGTRGFEDQVRAMPQITAADNVAGEMDDLLSIVARDVAELHRVLARLATHGGRRLVTYLRLEEVKPPSPFPLAPTPAPPARAPRAR